MFAFSSRRMTRRKIGKTGRNLAWRGCGEVPQYLGLAAVSPWER